MPWLLCVWRGFLHAVLARRGAFVNPCGGVTKRGKLNCGVQSVSWPVRCSLVSETTPTCWKSTEDRSEDAWEKGGKYERVRECDDAWMRGPVGSSRVRSCWMRRVRTNCRPFHLKSLFRKSALFLARFNRLPFAQESSQRV